MIPDVVFYFDLSSFLQCTHVQVISCAVAHAVLLVILVLEKPFGGAIASFLVPVRAEPRRVKPRDKNHQSKQRKATKLKAAHPRCIQVKQGERKQKRNKLHQVASEAQPAYATVGEPFNTVLYRTRRAEDGQ